jgi:hypothetical protein
VPAERGKHTLVRAQSLALEVVERVGEVRGPSTSSLGTHILLSSPVRASLVSHIALLRSFFLVLDFKIFSNIVCVAPPSERADNNSSSYIIHILP